MKDTPGADHTRDLRLAHHLRQHHAAISVGELRALGYTRSAIPRLVERGLLQRVELGVYRAASAPSSQENRLRCALLSVGDDAMLTRISAAHHQGFLDFPPPMPQIATPRRLTKPRRETFVVQRITNLLAGDILVADGLRFTSPLRTMIELAGDASTPSGLKILRRALRQATIADRGLPARLDAAIHQRVRFRGSLILRGTLEEHTPDSVLTRSPLEVDFLDFCRQHGLPLPATNVQLAGHEVDAVWFFAKLFVELDTYTFHGGVRSFEADRKRDADLLVAGFQGIRITNKRLQREPLVVANQLRVLLSRTA